MSRKLNLIHFGKLGIHPTAVRFRLAWGKKGGLIEYARKNSGL